jgi:arylsulfatase A-like enzyme
VEPVVKQHFLRRGYYAAVSYYDSHFGLVLDALDDVGAAKDTVVLVTGDQ